MNEVKSSLQRDGQFLVHSLRHKGPQYDLGSILALTFGLAVVLAMSYGKTATYRLVFVASMYGVWLAMEILRRKRWSLPIGLWFGVTLHAFGCVAVVQFAAMAGVLSNYQFRCLLSLVPSPLSVCASFTLLYASISLS